MEKPYFRTWPFNFGAIENQNFERAKIIIVPLPCDLTVSWSWKGGVREGPYAIIQASRQLDELFYEGENPFPVFTFDEVELSQVKEGAILGVEKIVKNILQKNKFPLLLGGEHSISVGGVKAAKDKYSNLSVLQLDAHPDLLNNYAGTQYNHACTMRRIKDFKIPTVQVGIRSIDPETKNYLKKERIKNVFMAPEIPKKKILNGLTKNVYLTIDLDVFDPSIMPSVSTPVPGGLGWYEVLDLIETLAKNKNIVGADIVELCPIPGLIAPNILAAKLTYKIISHILSVH